MEPDAARIAVVIEDDVDIRNLVTAILREAGFTCIATADGFEGIEAVREHQPVLITLDVRMPGIDGFEVARRIRAFSNTYVIMLSARSDEIDTLMGLDAGADDYLTKPFNIDELLMRVRAILRRSSPKSDNGMAQAVVESHLIKVRDYVLDTRAYKLNGPRGEIQLTPVQYDLLYHLMSHPGQIFSPNRLLQEVWDYPSDAGSPDLVRVHVKNLRERVEADPRNPTFIRTVPGHGYMVGTD